MNSESSRPRVSLKKSDYGISSNQSVFSENEIEKMLSDKEAELKERESMLFMREESLKTKESKLFEKERLLNEMESKSSANETNLKDFKTELDKMKIMLKNQNQEKIQKLESEKRYKVLKIEHYDEKLNEAEKETILYTILSGIYALGLPLNLLTLDLIWALFASTVITGLLVVQVRKMINAIIKKTSIKYQIDNLNLDVEQIESELKKMR